MPAEPVDIGLRRPSLSTEPRPHDVVTKRHRKKLAVCLHGLKRGLCVWARGDQPNVPGVEPIAEPSKCRLPDGLTVEYLANEVEATLPGRTRDSEALFVVLVLDGSGELAKERVVHTAYVKKGRRVACEPMRAVSSAMNSPSRPWPAT